MKFDNMERWVIDVFIEWIRCFDLSLFLIICNPFNFWRDVQKRLIDLLDSPLFYNNEFNVWAALP